MEYIISFIYVLSLDRSRRCFTLCWIKNTLFSRWLNVFLKGKIVNLTYCIFRILYFDLLSFKLSLIIVEKKNKNVFFAYAPFFIIDRYFLLNEKRWIFLPFLFNRNANLNSIVEFMILWILDNYFKKFQIHQVSQLYQVKYLNYFI
jgi:hypothetical protein